MVNSDPSQPQRRGAGVNGGLEPNAAVDGALPDVASAIDQRVARRIRARRLRSGMTLQTLAQDIGVAFQQAHKYERGQSRISAGRLFQIARALGAPITYFFLPDNEAKALHDGVASQALPDAPSAGTGTGPTKLMAGFVGDRRGATAVLFALAMTGLLSLAGRDQFAVDNTAPSAAIQVTDDYQPSAPIDLSTADVDKRAMNAASNSPSTIRAVSLTADATSSQTCAPTGNGCTDGTIFSCTEVTAAAFTLSGAAHQARANTRGLDPENAKVIHLANKR